MEPLRSNHEIADRPGASGGRSEPDANRSTPLALVVDRDANSRSLFATHLGLNGYAIEEASDGREALAKAIARLPDVIVMETRLPGIDGYELCRLLRNDHVTRLVPIVMLTSDVTSTALTRGKALGADSVLTKPCLPDALLADLQRLLSQSDHLHAPNLPMTDVFRKSGEHGPRSRAGAPLSRGHHRYATAKPPLKPPDLMCPVCDSQLAYEHSHVGGVSERHSEQWDDFRCPAGCGEFQYRQRTRKVTRKHA